MVLRKDGIQGLSEPGKELDLYTFFKNLGCITSAACILRTQPISNCDGRFGALRTPMAHPT